MAHEVDNNLSSTGFISNKRIDLSQELNNKITLKLERRLTAIKIDIKYKGEIFLFILQLVDLLNLHFWKPT